jgi:hypothetical protein
MRLLAPLLLTAILTAAAYAQTAAPTPVEQGLIGPSFPPSAMKPDNYDAVFDVKVAAGPGVRLLRNQTVEARYDAAVCNSQGASRGGAQVDHRTKNWSYLEPNACTMFANISQLDLMALDVGGEWIAKVYLRAHR